MKTYRGDRSLHIVGQAWEVRRKLQTAAKTSKHATLDEWLNGPKSRGRVKPFRTKTPR